MSYKRGDVVSVVYHPATAGPQRIAKPRPMVIISADTYHSERSQDVVAALVTSKVTKYKGATDYALRDWRSAGLTVPSAVRCTLATIEQSQLGGKVGTLSASDLRGVEAVLKRALGL